MPTYEYICRACGHEFEEFHSIKADPIAVCPKCRKKRVERKIGTGGAVIFKGGGFYETDYRSESYKSGAEAEKKAGTGAEAKGDAGSKGGASHVKGDVKGDAKADGKADAKTDTNPSPTAQAKASANAASKPGPKQDAKSSSAPGSAPNSPSAGESSRASDAVAAENKRIESRATHQSRIGRGVGNIVRKAPPAKKKR
jgi:putative FmdB family regulatory protein